MFTFHRIISLLKAVNRKSVMNLVFNTIFYRKGLGRDFVFVWRSQWLFFQISQKFLINVSKGAPWAFSKIKRSDRVKAYKFVARNWFVKSFKIKKKE